MAGTNAAASPAGKNIIDLPLELQKEIFKHSPSTDLISLSLVSKAFHDIAAANLYRNFHIIFPDDDDTDYDSPIDALASSLDTYATSDYDYAQYLKDVTFDTLVGGEKAERAYRQFTYDNSCGKFMSTLFVLALRNARALEKFKWNIRVELSRPVFQALHRIPALQHLHMRMHSGYSLYEPPPPLACDNPGFSNHETQPQTLPPYASPLPTALFESKSGKAKLGRRKGSTQKKLLSTFGGFRDLKTLCVLDMDTHEYLNEIQECIKNSSRTLHKLKLSFSESLANQSRKTVLETDDEDSDPDDPFPPNPHPATSTPTPATARATEDEKKAQEAVLSTIFGFEPAQLAECEQSDGEEGVSGEALHKSFIDDVRYHISRLLTAVHGPGSRINLQKDVLDAVVKAATKYTEAEAAKELEKKAAEKMLDGGENVIQDTSNGVAKDDDLSSNLFGPANDTKGDGDASNPEDFDIESPETGDVNDWEATEADVPAENIPVSKTVVEDIPKPDVTEPGATALGVTQPNVTNQDVKDIKGVADGCVGELSAADKDEQMKEYIRETRGFALQTLAIYLIPIKASVLSRAIDFRVLTRITLLNVGAQSPLWTLLSKMNKTSPLPLCKLFTDNVTLPFLNLISELECVTELFMLERSSNRQKVESSTPKTTITREQIRALALRKHVKSLRRLMIKNENDYSWDVSEKTIMLLCRKGKFLEELAVSCGIKSIHTLFQKINGLKLLKALHIISFRAEDTCVFVIQELRRFAIDIMSCHPQLKLEYIGLGSTLARITRVVKKSEPKTEGKKGKSKAKSSAIFNTGPLSPIGIDGFGLSDSESEYDSDEGFECGSDIKLEVSESMRFCEVVGVRIFRKDVVHGRL